MFIGQRYSMWMKNCFLNVLTICGSGQDTGCVLQPVTPPDENVRLWTKQKQLRPEGSEM